MGCWFGISLDAQVFLMNVDSSRYVPRLDKMRASGNMKWDLIAVDNNMLGVLAAKDLVEELSVLRESDELIPATLLPSLNPLLECGDELCFAPFRANVKIAYYNEEKFAVALFSPAGWGGAQREVSRSGWAGRPSPPPSLASPSSWPLLTKTGCRLVSYWAFNWR